MNVETKYNSETYKPKYKKYKPKTKIVLYPNIARKLLKMGYTIVDIKPKKENPVCSLFIFKIEGDFEKDFNELMVEFEAWLAEKEAEKDE